MRFGEHSLARLMRISKRTLDACADEGDVVRPPASPVSISRVIDDIITPVVAGGDVLERDPDVTYAHLTRTTAVADVDGPLGVGLLIDARPEHSDHAAETWL